MEKQVFRIIKKVQEFPKLVYKALEKKTLSNVHPVIYSITKPSNGLLNLPLRKTAIKSLNKSNAIVLIDFFLEEDELNVPETEIKMFELKEYPFEVEIFNFKKENEGIELWLSYQRNADRIGEPSRDDFFILNFKKNDPVVFRINGTKEFNSKGRRERIFLEHFYYIEWLGALDVNPVKKENQEFKITLPVKEAKEINLRKLFY